MLIQSLFSLSHAMAPAKSCKTVALQSNLKHNPVNALPERPTISIWTGPNPALHTSAFSATLDLSVSLCLVKLWFHCPKTHCQDPTSSSPMSVLALWGKTNIHSKARCAGLEKPQSGRSICPEAKLLRQSCPPPLPVPLPPEPTPKPNPAFIRQDTQ